MFRLNSIESNKKGELID